MREFTLLKHTIQWSEITRRKLLLINNFLLAVLTITGIYRRCRQIELFFKWIKQHLQSKPFKERLRMWSKPKYGLLSQFMLVPVKKQLRSLYVIFTNYNGVAFQENTSFTRVYRNRYDGRKCQCQLSNEFIQPMSE